MSVDAVTVSEAAKRLSVSTRTIHRLASLGKLRKIQIGPGLVRHHFRILVEDINALLHPGNPTTPEYVPAYLDHCEDYLEANVSVWEM